MIIFKEKQYTLKEGHYTGPKDPDEVPGAIKTIAGATALGYAAGAVADKITEDSRKPKLGDEPPSWKTRGAQAGFVAGVMSKLLLNTIHNPMDSIKFQELDKSLRRSFGMYRASGITIGDSRENRERMKESFVINSKKVTDFKINVTVAKGKLVMYTLELTEKQEEDLNDILDYYCKKYFGMKYTSTPLKNKGSWSITIVFTNHQVAANFLIEVGETLGVRQNILNDDLPEADTKMFSWVPFLDKTELKDLFSRGILKIVSGKVPYNSKGLTDMLVEGLSRLKALECTDIGIKSPREDYGNKYLEKVLQKLDPRGTQWTAAQNDSDLNLYLFRGTLMVCASHGSKEEGLMKGLRELKPVASKSSGSASLWTYQMKTPGDLEVVLRKIIGTKAKLNIYVP